MLICLAYALNILSGILPDMISSILFGIHVENT